MADDLQCVRVGFTGTGTDDYDGPEEAVTSVLRRLEAQGCTVVSVSILRSTRGRERYEAFIVFRCEGP